MNHNNIPVELKSLPQWVNWRHENIEGKDKKPPLNPKTGYKADHSDPQTWGTYEQAIKRDADRIGFVFTRECGYWGVDLDGCRDPETFAIEPWAREIFAELVSYTEKSPSGTGFHVICKGSLPVDGRRSGPIEVYASLRYLTVTGDTFDHDHTVIKAHDGAAFIKKHFAASDGKQVKVDFTKGKVWTKLPTLAAELLANPGGETHGGDRSAQDFACIVSLLKSGMSDSDAAATFVASPRGDDAKKRKAKLEYYIEHTIQRAREKMELRFDHHHPLSSVEAMELDWLEEEHFIARGMLHHIFGPKEVGKTKYADCLTTLQTKKGNIVIRFNTEDSERIIMKPCLHAAGANLDLVEIPGDIDGQIADFSQEGHRQALKHMIQGLNATLVVIEPLNDHKGRTNSNSDDMKLIYNALAHIAEETGAAIITVGATNKKDLASVLDKAAGDSSHVRTARVNLYIQRDRDDKKLIRVMNAGSNIYSPIASKGQAFKIIDQPPFLIKEKNFKNIGIAVMADQKSYKRLSADEALEESKTPSHANAIVQFLAEYLKGRNWVSTGEVKLACRDENSQWNWGNIRKVFMEQFVQKGLGKSNKQGNKTLWSTDPQKSFINGHDYSSTEIGPDEIDKERLKKVI